MNTQLLVLNPQSWVCPTLRAGSVSAASHRTAAASLPILPILLLLTLSLHVTAAEKRVRQDGSGDFLTIQSAVNAMQAGDVCLIGPGTYDERITFPARISGQASAMTTLRAEKPGSVSVKGLDTADCSFLRLEQLNISAPQSIAPPIDAAGILIRSAGVEVISNTFKGLKLAISGTGTNVLVRGNQLVNCGTAIEFSGVRWLVEGNQIESNQRTRTDFNTAQIRFAGAEHVIRNNHLTARAGESVDTFPAGLANTAAFQRIVIENNLLEGAFGIGIDLRGDALSGTSVSIRNNVMAEMRTGAIAATGGVKDIRLFNNTVVSPGRFAVQLLDRSAAEVKNNVFFSEHPDKAPREFVYAVDATSLFTHERNLICVPNATTNLFPGDLVTPTAPFVSLRSRNYRLRPGGLGIDQGIALEGFNTDREGTPRTGGNGWDVGAYELDTQSVPKPEKPGGLRLIVK